MDESHSRLAVREPTSGFSLGRVFWLTLSDTLLTCIDILPDTFDTPMFWTDEELAQLKGTEILPRIGKQKSEEQYTQVLLPLITANPQLFDADKCGLDQFHRMGSLVLAYSFGRTDESDNEDNEVDKNDIAMVPMADMLNANPELNNVYILQSRAHHRLDYINRVQDGRCDRSLRSLRVTRFTTLTGIYRTQIYFDGMDISFPNQKTTLWKSRQK
jgi:hypothetical protein